ncbi:hypothetical protein [Amycolatopsis minnesotensis]|uniref:Uncharacterized protein n=1 Tax=Amycolatopsis minnesotensis TaxID=337894 RepID=A0ABP5DZP0_9PSEU
MSIARKDDRHNDDLVKEIAEGFNRAVGAKKTGDSGDSGEKPKPRFVVTGDNRTPPPRGRKSR